MKRVAAVIHGPAYGGAHNQLAMLREPLGRRDFELVAVVPEESVAAERLRRTGVETHVVPFHRLRATRDPRVQAGFAARFWPEVRQLRQTLRNLGADVVQSHGVTNPHAAIAAHTLGLPNVWQIFDTRAPMVLRRAFIPLLLRLSDAASCWGRELARMHPGLSRLGDRLVYVFPPVQLDRFAPDPLVRARTRSELDVSDDDVLVGSVGVRNPQKGHEWLVRAAAHVRKAQPKTVFRVVGGASPAHAEHMAAVEREVARAGLGNSFRFIDPGARVAELLRAFDIFAMTSVPRSEGMPTVILEAMACAKPVVATDVGATRELVEDGVTGRLVAPLDAVSIAAEISNLVADQALRDRYGRAGLARARGRFDLESLANLHALTYHKAIEYRGRRG